MMRVCLVVARVANTPQPAMGDRRFSSTPPILPVADAPRIDVDEVRAGIEADAPDLEPLRLVAQVLELDARHADVDRLAVDVQTVGRHAAVRAAALRELRVG